MLTLFKFVCLMMFAKLQQHSAMEQQMQLHMEREQMLLEQGREHAELQEDIDRVEVVPPLPPAVREQE